MVRRFTSIIPFAFLISLVHCIVQLRTKNIIMEWRPCACVLSSFDCCRLWVQVHIERLHKTSNNSIIFVEKIYDFSFSFEINRYNSSLGRNVRVCFNNSNATTLIENFLNWLTSERGDSKDKAKIVAVYVLRT